jgi:hypothetical protein
MSCSGSKLAATFLGHMTVAGLPRCFGGINVQKSAGKHVRARGPIDSRPDTREPRRLGAAGLRSPSHMLENVHGTEGAMKETHPTEQVFRARKGPRLEGRKRDNCPE